MDTTHKTCMAFCLLSLSMLTGCSMNTSLLSIQDKFTYPNGDYESLGRVTAKRSYTRLLSAPVMTREVFRDLEQQALASKSGADVMVDYVASSNIVALPYLYLPALSITTFELEGTALRFRELGGQQFRDSPATGAH